MWKQFDAMIKTTFYASAIFVILRLTLAIFGKDLHLNNDVYVIDIFAIIIVAINCIICDRQINKGQKRLFIHLSLALLFSVSSELMVSIYKITTADFTSISDFITYRLFMLITTIGESFLAVLITTTILRIRKRNNKAEGENNNISPMSRLSFFLLIAFIISQGCNNTENSQLNEEVHIGAVGYAELQIARPSPFEPMDSSETNIKYGDGVEHIQATLYANRLYNVDGEDLQTYSLSVANSFKNDTFYFALPPELNRHCRDLKVFKGLNGLHVGYRNDSGKMISLYEIYLGQYNLNRGRIFMRAFDTNKLRP